MPDYNHNIKSCLIPSLRRSHAWVPVHLYHYYPKTDPSFIRSKLTLSHLASSQTVLTTPINLNAAKWSQIMSLSSPCSKCTPHPSHSRSSQSPIFRGICDCINPDSNLILTLLSYFSPLWSFAVPRMPLVLSLLCTFVLSNHHSGFLLSTFNLGY